MRVGLFRPITLRPFPAKAALDYLSRVKKIVIVESALGQLSGLFKDELYELSLPIIDVNKPAVGFTPKEIANTIKSLK